MRHDKAFGSKLRHRLLRLFAKGVAQNESEPCGDAKVGEDCFWAVKWLLNTGIHQTPASFPELGKEPSFADAQLAFYNRADHGCKRPCGLAELGGDVTPSHAICTAEGCFVLSTSQKVTPPCLRSSSSDFTNLRKSLNRAALRIPGPRCPRGLSRSNEICTEACARVSSKASEHVMRERKPNCELSF